MAVNPENYFTGDGSRTSFEFSFEYIDETDVKVSVNGTVRPTTEYSFANAVTILFDTAPDDGVEVRIYRDTNVDELKSTFFAGSSIRAQDLNQNFEQNNFAVQELKAYSWDNETATIHSDETWVSSDTQIATTAAMDARFLDEAAETILSTETWVSDDDHIATTASIDARFQDELSETITSSETWANNDDTIATTAAIDDQIDLAITNDIGTDGTGITVTDDGDGTITLGLGAGTIDLDRIKAADIDISSDTWSNNDTTIATTAKIDDMIDEAITGDILVDSTGLSKSTLGGQTTLGIAAGSVDLDRIKAGDIINLAEQDAGPTTADTSIFTSSAAAKRFDTLVQTATPSGSDYQVGKTWLQNDDDLTLSIWNGTGWTAVSSGGTFTEQPSVVYVDQASGDNANTGHRISTPKATIKAAIEQINAEIGTEITSGGSGYVAGTYTTVSLTGGNGTGLTADITVNASGVVSAVTVNSTTVLEDYSIGDVLSANNADLGGSGSGLQITVNGDGDGQIVIVSAGAYPEAAPIQIKRRNVSIIGQSLRSCIVHPTSATETNTLFELNSGSYISNLTLTGVKAGTGTGNTLDAVLPTTQGWNFAFYDDAFITKSPYIQNCTNFSDSEIENNPASPNYLVHNPAGGQAGDTDSAPTGGGLLVNGATPHDNSPLRSMVCDSYTHVGLNGPGILVTNNGYLQATSSYAFFNRYHIKCLNGGQANLAASTTDFGTQALVADGKSTTNIITSTVNGNFLSGVDTFTINAPTADASWHGTSTRPQTNMLVTVNSVTYPILSAVANGSGWDVEISRPDPTNRSNNLGLNGNISDGAAVQFFLRSQIASSGHTMEYVGSGTNYLALPENGGVPIEANQVVESNNGKIWTATTDHNGKFKVGDFFEVDQQLGFVTIPEGSIAFDLLSDQSPQLGANLDVNGQSITSASNGNIVLNPDGTGLIDLAGPTGVTGGFGVTGDAIFGAQVFLENGTAADPALAWGATNQDTGIYSPGEDQLAISTGGTGRLFVDASGRVGVGVGSSLFGVLHVREGTDANVLFATEASEAAIQTFNNAGNTEVPLVLRSSILKFRTSNTEQARIDSDGRLLVGTSTARANFFNGTTDPHIQLEGTDTPASTVAAIRCSDNAGSPRFLMGKARGSSVGSNTIVNEDDDLGEISFQGSDGTEFVQAADIRAEVDGTPGANDMPGRLVFSTTADGASSPTERMRIDSSGRVGIGTGNAGDFASNANQLVINTSGNGGLTIATGSSSNGHIFFADGTTGDQAYRGIIKYEHGNDAMTFSTAGGNERARIDSSGRLLVGTTTVGSASADNLTIADTGDCGITIRSGTSNNGAIYFSDGTTGSDQYQGYLIYEQTGQYLRIGANATERIRIESGGKTKFSGGVYGLETTITASDFDLNDGNFFTCGAIAIPNPTNGVAGMSGLIRVTAAPTSFGSNWDFPGGSYTAPTAFPAVAPFYIVDSSTFLLGNWTEGIA